MWVSHQARACRRGPNRWAHWVATLGFSLAAGGTAQAALINQGDGTVKDSLTQLVWLQDWNLTGMRNWLAQEVWAKGLSFAGSSD